MRGKGARDIRKAASGGCWTVPTTVPQSILWTLSYTAGATQHATEGPCLQQALLRHDQAFSSTSLPQSQLPSRYFCGALTTAACTGLCG